MLSEGLFIDHEGHPLRVAAVAALEDIDRPLHAASGHADVGVGGEPGGPRRRGGVREEPQLRQEGYSRWFQASSGGQVSSQQ